MTDPLRPEPAPGTDVRLRHEVAPHGLAVLISGEEGSASRALLNAAWVAKFADQHGDSDNGARPDGVPSGVMWIAMIRVRETPAASNLDTTAYVLSCTGRQACSSSKFHEMIDTSAGCP